ncbi:hypothetical protein F2Q70_00011026 [Brassica cretica]|uniref:Uncharacterized protein n=1 Tax=Brassica cretica TaxID=69181 RepID=A0A8S9M4V5_BRACR|nr:hypothetical protein F2Q70_00011026 [Brassica cretica]
MNILKSRGARCEIKPKVAIVAHRAFATRGGESLFGGGSLQKISINRRRNCKGETVRRLRQRCCNRGFDG